MIAPSHRRLLSLTAAGALVVTMLGVAQGSTPASSSVTASTQVGRTAATSWTGVTPGGANPDSACTGQTPKLEDHHTVTVRVPAGLYRTKAVRLEVSMTGQDLPVGGQAPLAADTIITLARHGKVLGSSDNYSVAAGEHLFVFNPAPGSYDVAICTFAGAPTLYKATLSLTTLKAGAVAPPVARGPKPAYRVYPAPAPVLTNCKTTCGEPSIGADWRTQVQPLMFQASLWTYKVTIVSGHATWTDVSAPSAVVSLDPILFTDRYTSRTFESQLTGQDSLTMLTDDDGTTWLPSQGGGVPSGVDHQTVGGGHYPASLKTLAQSPAYPDAIYYCSQDLETAFCARSDDGGATFGAGVPIYGTECSGIHGHVKVAPDGTVYVPNKACDGKQGVAVSSDAGVTWTLREIPGSTNGQSDPAIGIDDRNNVYYTYADADGHERVSVSHDRGAHWSKPADVGARLGVANAVFPSAVGGSRGHAAVAFLGTTTKGNSQDEHFGMNAAHDRYVGGAWYLYIATTYDGGKHWVTVNATPNDPVQRGSICLGGISCPSKPDTRNLLDFIDVTTDRLGRVAVAYTDGCTSYCVHSREVSDNSLTGYPALVRQERGTTLR